MGWETYYNQLINLQQDEIINFDRFDCFTNNSFNNC